MIKEWQKQGKNSLAAKFSTDLELFEEGIAIHVSAAGHGTNVLISALDGMIQYLLHCKGFRDREEMYEGIWEKDNLKIEPARSNDISNHGQPCCWVSCNKKVRYAPVYLDQIDEVVEFLKEAQKRGRMESD